MQIEINELIKALQKIADNQKGEPLNVICYNAHGDIGNCNPEYFDIDTCLVISHPESDIT